MSRRVGRSEIIDRLHQSATHQRFPKTVHHRLGKVRVVASGQPIGKYTATIFRIGWQKVSTRDLHQGSFPRIRVYVFSNGIEPDNLSTCELREHRSESMKVILRPFIQRMIVTVGTLHPTAHKDLGDEFRLQPGILNCGIECRWPILGRITAGSDNLSGHLIVAHTITQLLGQPVVKSTRCLRCRGN